MFSLQKSDRPYLNSFLFGFMFNAISLHWTSIFVGSTPWIILAIGQALFFLPLGIAKRMGLSFYPLIFIALEQLRTVFPFEGFGWLRIAYSQADAPYSGMAAYGGAIALSTIAVCIGLVIFSVLKTQIFVFPLLPLLVLLIPINIQILGDINALLVQGDVPSLGLDFNSRATEVFYNHVTETRRALKTSNNIDFILWPENAVDIDPFSNPKIEQELNGFDVPLIVGAVIRRHGLLENTSILWTKSNQKIYVKRHLTPFGEYIPLKPIAAKISHLVDGFEDFSAGKEAVTFNINDARIVPVLCYEIIDDKIMLAAARASNLIVVQTNSATFGVSAESAQQLDISRVRAIEHGRNILSVSTSGLSAVINSDGEASQLTKIHEPAHILAKSALMSGLTPRDRLGDWSVVLSFLWLLIVARTKKPLGI